MPRASLVLVLLLGVAQVASAGTSRPGDALASVNLNPFRQVLLASPVRGAEQPDAGDVVAGLRTSYASYFALKSDEELDLFVDNELLRFDLQAEVGLTDRIAVRIALPLMAYTGGFLDPVAEVIDDAVGTPSDDRKAVGSNRFHFELAEVGGEGARYRVPEGRFGPGDLLLEARVRLLDELDGWPALALWGALELPTGSVEAARGNGDVDAGFGLIAARDAGPVRVSLGLGLVFAGTPDPLERFGLETRPAVEGHLGVGWTPCEAWDLIAQLDYGQNPYRGSSLAPFDRDALELGLGLRWRTEPVDVEFVFVEDLIAASSTDFTIVLNLTSSFSSVF